MLSPQLAPAAAAAVADGDVASGNDAAAADYGDAVGAAAVGDDGAEMFDEKVGAVGGG